MPVCVVVHNYYFINNNEAHCHYTLFCKCKCSTAVRAVHKMFYCSACGSQQDVLLQCVRFTTRCSTAVRAVHNKMFYCSACGSQQDVLLQCVRFTTRCSTAVRAVHNKMFYCSACGSQQDVLLQCVRFTTRLSTAIDALIQRKAPLEARLLRTFVTQRVTVVLR